MWRIEALTVIDILRRGNVDVIGASINDTLGINGAHNIDFKANVTFNDINFDDVDMIVLPGGYEGRNNLLHMMVCVKYAKILWKRTNILLQYVPLQVF